jgi:hypothetical protein
MSDKSEFSLSIEECKKALLAVFKNSFTDDFEEISGYSNSLDDDDEFVVREMNEQFFSRGKKNKFIFLYDENDEKIVLKDNLEDVPHSEIAIDSKNPFYVPTALVDFYFALYASTEISLNQNKPLYTSSTEISLNQNKPLYTSLKNLSGFFSEETNDLPKS